MTANTMLSLEDNIANHFYHKITVCIPSPLGIMGVAKKQVALLGLVSIVREYLS